MRAPCSPDYAAAEADLKLAEHRGQFGAMAALYMGAVHANRGTWRAEHGEDPLPDWKAAERAYTDSLAMWYHSDTLVRRGTLLANRGLYRDRGGEGDPLPDFAAAEKDFDAALEESSSRLARVWSRRAVLRANRALHVSKTGGDPIPDWAAAEKDYGEALARQPNDAMSFMGRGDVRWNRARFGAGRRDIAGARRDYGTAADDFEAAMAANPALKAALAETAAEARKLSR